MHNKLQLFNATRPPDIYVKSLKEAQLFWRAAIPSFYPLAAQTKNYLNCESDGNPALKWLSQLFLNIQLWCGLHNS